MLDFELMGWSSLDIDLWAEDVTCLEMGVNMYQRLENLEVQASCDFIFSKKLSQASIQHIQRMDCSWCSA